jgi:glucokinase-like ROK family protein
MGMDRVIALDVGGTLVKFGVVSKEGQLIGAGSFETRAGEGGQSLMARILAKTHDLSADYPGSGAVALSSPGLISADHGSIVFAGGNLPGWSGMPVARRVRQGTGLPCYVENDVNAAALGERWLGAAQGCRMLLMLALGTGVGGAAIARGQLITGAGGGAGEFGHIVLYPGGHLCTCGQNGCLEQYASTGALKRRTGVLPEGHPARGDVRALFQSGRAGDEAALKVLDEWVYDLSVGIASLTHAFNPDVVLLGGGVSEQGDFLLNRVRAQLQRLVIPSFFKGLNVEAAKLGNDAALLGAAKAVFEKTEGMLF